MMRQYGILLLLLTAWLNLCQAQLGRSNKRGLVDVSAVFTQQDEGQWTRPDSDITWYYTYSPYPISAYSSLEFVPMLFTIPDPGNTTFTDQTTTLLQSNSISHILSFNEPDGPTYQGGTDLDASAAAQSYIDVLLPLRSAHPSLKLGLPAVSGSQRGLTWLSDFNTSCHRLAPKTGCSADFIPIHWYGDFPSLASWIGQIRSLYPSLPIWVTEFAYPLVSTDETASYFNSSIQYLDRLSYVERYSYFGSFRSTESNIGGNVAMLDENGALTELGSEYLGINGTGTLASASSAAGRIDLEGSRHWMFGVWAVVVSVWIFTHL